MYFWHRGAQSDLNPVNLIGGKRLSSIVRFLTAHVPVDWRWNGRNGERHQRAGCGSAGQGGVAETGSHPTGEQDQQTWHGPVQRQGFKRVYLLSVVVERKHGLGLVSLVNSTVMFVFSSPVGAARPRGWSPSAGGHHRGSEVETVWGPVSQDFVAMTVKWS